MTEQPDSAWWKEAVVYQIYPRSFQDTDGDGIGDLQGVIRRLDHVAELGADVIWLNPVYESPHRDNGYDIADYRAIDETYGTMADWEELLAAVHDRGMRLVMDLVVNHTSTDHEWFRRSRAGEAPYDDFYHWHEGDEPPNNWESGFGGSAWRWDEEREAWYLGLFDETQADVDWSVPAVREAVYDVVNWWLDRGVDGFRLDVIDLLSKPAGLPDGDPERDWVGTDQFADGPRLLEYLEELAAETFGGRDVTTVGECVGADVATASEYVGPDGPLDTIFHFEHVGVDAQEGWLGPTDWELDDLRTVLSRWQTELDGWNALYLTNHDQPRIVSRFGDDERYRVASAKLLGTLLFTLRGTPYVYQGQEIGTTNHPWSSLDEFDDPQTVGKVEAAIEAGEIDSFEAVREIAAARSRDNARTPVQWDDSEHAGFTDGEPWLPVSPEYTEVNVAAAETDPDSVLAYYRDLRALRAAHDVLVYGEYELCCPDHDRVWAYRRHLAGADPATAFVTLNFSDEPATVELADAEGATRLLGNYPDGGETPPRLTLAPWEARVYGR